MQIVIIINRPLLCFVYDAWRNYSLRYRHELVHWHFVLMACGGLHGVTESLQNNKYIFEIIYDSS